MSTRSWLLRATLFWMVTSPVGSGGQGLTGSMHLDLSHDKPFVRVLVNGQGPFRFVVDTGTGGEAFITSALMEKLGLVPAGQMHLADPSGVGARTVPMVVLDSVQVAGVSFTGVKAAVHKLDDEGGECDGLLGFALFRNMLLTLDFPGRMLRLETGSLAPDGERSILPFSSPAGIPIISMALGPHETAIGTQLDSGGIGLSVPEGTGNGLKFYSVPKVYSNVHSVATRFQVKGARLASDVKFGQYTFRRPFLEINPAFPLANFGAEPMQKFALTFDQKNGLVRFVARKSILSLSMPSALYRLRNAAARETPDPQLVPLG
jgi:hypothetical protein